MLTETLPTSSRAEQPDSASVDDGLRSLLGIRWLLIVGALVVAVSTVHLMAGAWGGLAPFLKAAVLIAGALSIGAAGDVLRHRLRLPAAGSALLFLYCGLVPLLAWGAAARSFWQADFGWPTVAAGLVGLVLLSRRVMRQVLGYEGLFFPLAFGALLLAVPVLDAFAGSADLFLVCALVLGLLARAASRHVNRFFFHRDRLAQSEKPVHLLPFAMLALVYGLAMSRLGGALEDLAVPLAFLALMLIDTGEEYHAALCRALGKAPEAWPRRSQALLALGFASLAAALATAPFDPSGRALFVTAAIAAAVLLRWSVRYGSWISHGLGLVTAWLAYQTSPSVIPRVALEAHAAGSRWLDLAPGNVAWLGIGNLGAVFGLALLAFVLRPRLGVAQRRVHAVLMAFHGVLTAACALAAPGVALWLSPLVALLLAAAAKFTRRAELLPGVYLSASVGVGAAAWLIFEGSSWSYMMPLVAACLFGVAYMVLGWRGRQRLLQVLETGENGLRYALTLAPLVLSLGLPLIATTYNEFRAGVLVAVFALAWQTAAMVWSSRFCFRVAFLGLGATVALWLMAAGVVPLAAAVLAAQGLFLLDWRLDREAGRRSLEAHEFGGEALTAVGAFYLWVTFTPLPIWVHAALAAASLARAGWYWRRLGDGSGPLSPWVAQAWVLLGTAQLASMTWALDLGFWRLLGAAAIPTALVGLALGQRILAEALERRGRHLAAVPCRPLAVLAVGLGAWVSIFNGMTAAPSGVWLELFPAFMASLFFLVTAWRDEHRGLASCASMGIFATAALILLSRSAALPELHWLPPGLALIGLSRLLRREMGERFSLYVFSLGALCLYAMPTTALLGGLDWAWQSVLLVLSVGFGAASFRLRSRSLLVLSSAALLLDLTCLAVSLHRATPILLWVGGLLFGLGLMAAAAMLEHRREKLLQHVRVWGRQLAAWN